MTPGNPHLADEATEKAVLGMILLDPAGLDRAGEIAPEVFTHAHCREAFEAMRELRESGEAIDPVNLGRRITLRGEMLQGVHSFLAELEAEAVSAVELPGKLETLARLKSNRERDRLLRQAIDGNRQGEDVSPLLAELQELGGALQPPGSGESELVCLADVEPETVEYLWNPFLPVRKLTIVEGNPGCGKTSLLLQIAAALSRGGTLPGDTAGREPSITLYMTREDGLADTIRPRLEAYGGEPSRVFALQGKRTEGKRLGTFSLQDVAFLDRHLSQVRPALAVVDPVQSFLGPNVDMNKANEVRPVLDTLSGLAQKHGCAIVLIRHLGKQAKDAALYRGLGSIDFTAAARSQLLVAPLPDNPAGRVIAHVKASCSAPGKSLTFSLADGRFQWTGETDLQAHDLLAPEATSEERSAREEARQFVEEQLSDGPKKSSELFKAARALGHGDKTVRRVFRALGCRKERRSEGNRGQGGWWWSLPADDAGHSETDKLQS